MTKEKAAKLQCGQSTKSCPVTMHGGLWARPSLETLSVAHHGYAGASLAHKVASAEDQPELASFTMVGLTATLQEMGAR